jgi:hypothetical protein
VHKQQTIDHPDHEEVWYDAQTHFAVSSLSDAWSHLPPVMIDVNLHDRRKEVPRERSDLVRRAAASFFTVATTNNDHNDVQDQTLEQPSCLHSPPFMQVQLPPAEPSCASLLFESASPESGGLSPRLRASGNSDLHHIFDEEIVAGDRHEKNARP